MDRGVNASLDTNGLQHTGEHTAALASYCAGYFLTDEVGRSRTREHTREYATEVSERPIEVRRKIDEQEGL